MPLCFGSFCFGGDPETTTTSPRPTPTHTTPRATDPATTTQPFFSSLISRLLPTFESSSTAPSATPTSSSVATSSLVPTSSATPSFLPTIVTSTSTSLPNPTASNAAASASSTNASGGSSNTGAIVGAAFGAIVGAIVLAVIVGKFLSWRRQQKELREEQEATSYDPWVGGGAAAAAAGGRRHSRSSSGAGRPLERRPAGGHQPSASNGSWQQFHQQSQSHEPEMSVAYPQQAYGQQWGAPQPAYGRGAWAAAPPPPPAQSSPYMSAMSNPVALHPQARQPYETLPIGAQAPVAYHQENPYARNVTSPDQMRQRRMSRGANDAYGGMD